MSESKGKSFVLEFFFGGVAAFVSKTIASPIEVVKLRLQVQYALIEKGLIHKRYEGINDCFARLYQEDGLKAFFKGNGTNALRFFLTQALNFSLRDLLRGIMSELGGCQKEDLGFVMNILAGGGAGATSQLIVYPLDYARTRLANQVHTGGEAQFSGLLNCIYKTYQTDGRIGLYRGFTISCLCMVIYRGLYFGIYDSLRPYLPQKYESNMLVTFTFGYFATLASGVLSYPLDTVRRRIMMTSGEQKKFKSTPDCIRQMWRQGGWRVFYKGGAANVVGGVTGAAVLSIYDRIKLFYRTKHN